MGDDATVKIELTREEAERARVVFDFQINMELGTPEDWKLRDKFAAALEEADHAD